jgi:hypothetical protein
MAISGVLWLLSIFTAMPFSLGFCGTLVFSFTWGACHPGKKMGFVFLLLSAPFCGWVYSRDEWFLFSLYVGA